MILTEIKPEALQCAGKTFPFLAMGKLFNCAEVTCTAQSQCNTVVLTSLPNFPHWLLLFGPH